MRRLRTSLAGLALALAGTPVAHAQAPSAPAGPAAAEPAADPSHSAEVDAELREMARQQESGESEVVEIFDARPKQPIQRGTEIRLSYDDLVARGVTDLAGALRLLPDITVRDAGRGGFNIDVRGGRKGSVTVLIDGMAVTDPYYGTFDVSSIPVTDIVQIRMSPTPQSPLDGPGGSGGVIEVLTRDAIGPQLVIARVTGDSLPSFGATGLARVALSKHTALRISMSGSAGSREHPMPGKSTVDEDRHSSTGTARFEYRRGKRRVAADGFLDSRHYISPPQENDKGDIVMIDRELSARGSVKGDDEVGDFQVQGQAYAHYLARRSRSFTDARLDTQSRFEDLYTTRTGGAAVVAHPFGQRGRWAASASGFREQARVTDENDTVIEGAFAVVEAAAGASFETTRWRLEGAGGLAMPVNGGADPWPEAKLVARYQPRKDFGLTATGGHKGRVATLRERFAPQTGDPSLGPEKAWHAELRAIEQLGERLRVEVAPFYRRTTGLIRLLPVPDTDPVEQRSTNLGVTRFMGVDTQLRVKPLRFLEVGGNYSYIRARGDSEDPGLAKAPLDRLPSHRADAWVQVTPLRQLAVQARIKYFGASIDKTMEVAGYSTIEATVTAPITQDYLGVLRIDDLTDVRPETRKGYFAPGRVVSFVVQGSWE